MCIFLRSLSTILLIALSLVADMDPELEDAQVDLNSLEVKSIFIAKSTHAARVSYVDLLWDTPYGLSGQDIKVAIIDEGRVRSTHQEFFGDGEGRVQTLFNSGNLSAHSTHIAGTIGATGINPDAHGIANKTELYSYYFYDVAFAKSMLQAYEDDEILLSNHSYGYTYKVHVGSYNSDAMQIDQAVHDNPYLNAFIAAGNDRDKTNYEAYSITKGPVNAKNILSIGAIDDDGHSLASYSSTGPVLDGRIKPDLVANGTQLLSAGSQSDDEYFYLGGTSMATPVATGIAALMMQQYKQSTDQDIRHDLLKAIMINTAVDKGRVGPDYEYGYGLIDAKSAIDMIKTLETEKKYIQQGTLKDQEDLSYCIQALDGVDLKTTLAWIDPAGDPSMQEKTLVNDLDMRIKLDNCEVIYPYTLDKEHPSLDAKRDIPNSVDNIEQIVLSGSKERGFLLEISGREIVTESQSFSLVSNMPFVELPPTIRDLSVKAVDNETVQLRWNYPTAKQQTLYIYRNGKHVCTMKGSQKQFIDKGLVPNTYYSYKISIKDICGRESFSKAVCIKTPNEIIAPSNLTIKVISKSRLLLKWKDNSNNEDGFCIFQDGNLIYKTGANETSFIYNTDIHKQYSFKVVAFNESGMVATKKSLFQESRFSNLQSFSRVIYNNIDSNF